MPAVSRINIDRVAVVRIARTDPRMDVLLKRTAKEITAAALAVFSVQQRTDNEHRTSEYTPPKYAQSFYERKVAPGIWHAGNSDPGWALVEYGAHPGGHPDVFVLRYRPLARSLDIVAARNAGG